MAELKPCPFCGGKAEVVKSMIAGGGFFIICHDCEIRTFDFLRPETAVKRWNRRADNERVC